MAPEQTFDALVVGAGAGGLFAAVRLAHAGYDVREPPPTLLHANGGTTACAETTKLVVDKLLERFPAGASAAATTAS